MDWKVALVVAEAVWIPIVVIWLALERRTHAATLAFAGLL